MIFPVGDEPNPQRFAWVNTALIATNVAVYVFLTFPLSRLAPTPGDPAWSEYLQFLHQLGLPPAALRAALADVSRWDLVVFAHGFRPREGAVADLFTAMFMHAGFLHLAGNMLFLWIYGDNVEDRLGRLGYLLAYLATGAGATYFHMLFAPDSPVPTVGASGAISGVLGFYFLWFPKNRIKVFLAFFPWFMDVVRVPARIVLGFYLVIDNLFPFLLNRSETGVAYGAHIGGFLAGLGLAVILRPRPERPPLEPEARASSRPVELSAATVDERVAAGDIETAGRIYLDLWNSPQRRAVDPGAALRIARHFERPGWEKIALAVYQRYLADRPQGPWRDRAHLGAGLLLLGLGQPVAAYQHLVEAFEDTDDPAVRAAAADGLAACRQGRR